MKSFEYVRMTFFVARAGVAQKDALIDLLGAKLYRSEDGDKSIHFTWDASARKPEVQLNSGVSLCEPVSAGPQG